MDKIAEFVKRKRVVSEVKIEGVREFKIPWYKRPLEYKEFSYRRCKDGNLFVHHPEWSRKTWIGPYKDEKEVDSIIKSYVIESAKAPLDKKLNKNIHSIIVEDEKEFFE